MWKFWLRVCRTPPSGTFDSIYQFFSPTTTKKKIIIFVLGLYYDLFVTLNQTPDQKDESLQELTGNIQRKLSKSSKTDQRE